jgi:hypothetical protein
MSPVRAAERRRLDGRAVRQARARSRRAGL